MENAITTVIGRCKMITSSISTTAGESLPANAPRTDVVADSRKDATAQQIAPANHSFEQKSETCSASDIRRNY
jgi:hypothetical protein